MANDTLTNIIQLPTQAITESANTLVLAIPKIITAILILVLGWLIAKIIEIIVKKLLIASKVDEWIKKSKLKETLFNISVTQVLSLIVKYYIILIFMKEAAVRTGLTFLSELFDALLKSLPELTIGSTIVIITLIFADFVKKRINTSLIPFNETIAQVTYGIIIFFGIVIALPKFGVQNTSLIEDTFKYLVLGISFGISLAIGIGFGWAIKDGPAKELFKKKK